MLRLKALARHSNHDNNRSPESDCALAEALRAPAEALRGAQRRSVRGRPTAGPKIGQSQSRFRAPAGHSDHSEFPPRARQQEPTRLTVPSDFLQHWRAQSTHITFGAFQSCPARLPLTGAEIVPPPPAQRRPRAPAGHPDHFRAAQLSMPAAHRRRDCFLLRVCSALPQDIRHAPLRVPACQVRSTGSNLGTSSGLLRRECLPGPARCPGTRRPLREGPWVSDG